MIQSMLDKDSEMPSLVLGLYFMHKINVKRVFLNLHSHWGFANLQLCCLKLSAPRPLSTVMKVANIILGFSSCIITVKVIPQFIWWRRLTALFKYIVMRVRTHYANRHRAIWHEYRHDPLNTLCQVSCLDITWSMMIMWPFQKQTISSISMPKIIVYLEVMPIGTTVMTDGT